VGVEPQYTETIVGTKRRITANAIPDHDVGDFPNPGNPNAIAPQTLQFEVPLVPSGAGGPARYLGIARSGVLFDPGTAEVWNNDTAWRYEALRYETAPDYFGSDATNHPTALGLDCNFAHVQPTGAYHYHGVPTGAAGTAPSVRHVGWAADGAPVFARWGYELPDDPSSAVVELRSSYRLRSGARPSNGPPGDYDGTFVGDWEYVAGLGDLDACNGRTGRVTIDGELVETYHYVLTNTFPYIPRCTTYAADPSFEAGGGGPPACMPGQTMMCCGDGACDGPETPQNCAADC
jgi:hypothetical protein